MNRPPVLTKADFVRRYKEGEFGNAAPTWNTPKELAKSYYNSGLVHLRCRIAGGETFYNKDPWEAWCLWSVMEKPQNYYCSAMAPHHRGTIQGEVCDREGGLSLLWTHAKKPMREALAEFQRQVHRIESFTILRTYMNPRSYGWLQYLLEEYPGHVIEFTCFNINWGTIPGYNSIFWEVRNY